MRFFDRPVQFRGALHHRTQMPLVRRFFRSQSLQIFPLMQTDEPPLHPNNLPSSFTSISNARGTFGNPGISIIFPATTTTKPAPDESIASVTCSSQPVGAPNAFGSSDSEYWVFATQIGNPPNPHSVNSFSLPFAFSLNCTPSAP